MRSFNRSLVIVLVFFLALFSFIDYANAQQDLFPWVRFNGGFQTTAGIGTGSFNLNGFIFEMDYENDDVWNANVAGVETIHGAKVAINGATRTGPYSFNGVLIDPDDVTLTIKTTDGTHTFLEATLADATFTCDNLIPQTCWLNEGLDANDPATLNLTNIQLSTNDGTGGPGTGPYPSRYIDELAAYLAASNVSGMKMSLLIPPAPGFDFTANSSGPITFGLIDGLQSLNAPPVADAGATTTTNTCLATSCEITLDGSQSSDPDSTAGTNDDIVTFVWFDAGGASLGSGEVLPITLGLGMHDITLRVTDSAGATDEMTITIVIDPAELSLLEIDRATVKKDGKVKISGKLALPAGVSHFNVNSIGSATIGISTLGTVIDESVDFLERRNNTKWKYHANTALGIKRFNIDWQGSKFNYVNGPLSIKSRHIGEEETSLEITSCMPVTIDINGTVITIDENDNVSCPNAGTKIDGDDDGDSDDSDSDGGNSTDDDGDCTVRVTLPFELTSDMVITITGSVVDTVSVADYYSAAVGKFRIFGRFDASGVVFNNLSPKTLNLDVTLGDEGFSGSLDIDEATWTKIKSKYWKYKAN